MSQVSEWTKKNIYYYVGIILLRLVLDVTYNFSISTEFAYMGFVNYGNGGFLLSWVILFLFMGLCRHCFINEENALSKEIILLMFIISFVPFTSMVRFGAFNTKFVLCNTIYWLFLLVFIKDFHLKRIVKLRRTKKHIIHDNHIKILTLLSFFVVLYVSGRYTGFRFNFDLLNVYTLRSEARLYDLPTVLAYAFSWTRTVNSILIAYFMRKRNWVWAGTCLVVQLLNFGVDGSKITLFLAIFAVAINLLPRFQLVTINKLIIAGVTSITAICLGIYAFFNSLIPVSIITRRLFFVPVFIQSNYFDFFTTHTPDFFRQSFLRFFGFHSPYSNIPYLIGNLYSNQSSMSANNGLISDAIANLGVLGIIIMPFVLSLVLKILDKVSYGLDVRLYITVALYIAIMLTNSFLFTVLLTHGLIVTMFLLGSMNRENDNTNALDQTVFFKGEK